MTFFAPIRYFLRSNTSVQYKKLNLGPNRRMGYTNVDLNEFHGPDLVADITDIHQAEDGAADEVLAQDVLEHVPSTKVMPALVEWNRLLCSGGTLLVRVPDLRSIAGMFVAGAPEADLIQMLYGTQSYAGDFHMSGFTVDRLKGMLEEAGFSLASVEIIDRWLISATAQKSRSVRSEVFELAKDASLNNTRFVTAVFKALLGREPDPGGLQHFVQSMETGARDRYQVINTIANSEEGRRKGAALIHSDSPGDRRGASSAAGHPGNPG
jgi:predicted SAM-dependent methyltransferase